MSPDTVTVLWLFVPLHCILPYVVQPLSWLRPGDLLLGSSSEVWLCRAVLSTPRVCGGTWPVPLVFHRCIHMCHTEHRQSHPLAVEFWKVIMLFYVQLTITISKCFSNASSFIVSVWIRVRPFCVAWLVHWHRQRAKVVSATWHVTIAQVVGRICSYAPTLHSQMHLRSLTTIPPPQQNSQSEI